MPSFKESTKFFFLSFLTKIFTFEFFNSIFFTTSIVPSEELSSTTIISYLVLFKLNILEIGVLFGNSLKLWNDFFTKSTIYGVENFSQDNGHDYYSYKPVNPNDVINDLKKYERVNLLVFDCEDVNEIEKKLTGLEFDIIIDDGSHNVSQQKLNYTNYSKFLNCKIF